MRVVGLLTAAAVLLLLAGLGLWLWAEEPAGTAAPATAPPPPAAPRREVRPEEFRQWLRELDTPRKVGLLRVLISSLREDVLEQQRWAAEQWFHKADSDGNGQLSFEEAWQGGLFRPAAGRRDVRPGGGGMNMRPGVEGREPNRLERRPGPEAAGVPGAPGEQERRPAPEADLERGQQPPFPMNELEQELLESWELLQELNIIGRDADRR